MREWRIEMRTDQHSGQILIKIIMIVNIKITANASQRNEAAQFNNIIDNKIQKEKNSCMHKIVGK